MASDTELTDEQLREKAMRARERAHIAEAEAAAQNAEVAFENIIATLRKHAPVWTEQDESEHQRLERKKLCSAAYRRSNLKIHPECKFGSKWLQTKISQELHDEFRGWMPHHGNRLVSMKINEGKTLVIEALFGRIWADIIAERIPMPERSANLQFATVTEIVTKRKESDLGLAVLHDWIHASVLVIDEVGKVRDNFERDLFTVVDTRYRFDRPTIGLSGNPIDGRSKLRGDTLIDIYGAEFVKRLCDPNKGGKVIEVR